MIINHISNFHKKLKMHPEIPDYIKNELIGKIVIHSPEKTGGKKHVTIEVYFTYVGKIRIPLAKPELLTDTEKPA